MLIALLPVCAANSGTFLDDFNGDNLDEWHIQLAPGPPFPNLVWLEGGHLVIDTITERGAAILTWRRGFEEDWDTYTVTCRVRFMDVPPGRQAESFRIAVRKATVQEGDWIFPLFNQQVIWFYPRRNEITVSTFHPPPGDLINDNEPVHPLIRASLDLEPLGQPIKLNRWFTTKIVAKKSSFEFYFRDDLISRYEDTQAGPGTVDFVALGGVLVHVDDVKISGPEIPNIRNSILATTRGEIKDSLWR